MRREVLLTVVAMALGQAQDLPVVFTIEPTVITDCRDGMGRALLRWNDPAGRQFAESWDAERGAAFAAEASILGDFRELAAKRSVRVVRLSYAASIQAANITP